MSEERMSEERRMFEDARNEIVAECSASTQLFPSVQQWPSPAECIRDQAVGLSPMWNTSWMCTGGATLYDFSEENRVATKVRQPSTIYTIRAQDPLPEDLCVSFTMKVRNYVGNDMDLGICGENPRGAWMRAGESNFAACSWDQQSASHAHGETYPVGKNLFPTGSLVTVAVDTRGPLRKVEIWLDRGGSGVQVLVRQADVPFWPIYPAAAFRMADGSVEFLQEELPPK
eukprot:m.152755 g.152755  ORF g.152755 m.152755 type:complete len:229 (+) comp17446_c0_seq3:170-856(+)